MGVALAMDAFAVSIIKGVQMDEMHRDEAAVIALLFGGFQAIMPCLGWLLGANLLKYISAVDHWAVFLILLIIGIKNISESLRNDAAYQAGAYGNKEAIDNSIKPLRSESSRDITKSDISRNAACTEPYRKEIPGSTKESDVSNAANHVKKYSASCGENDLNTYRLKQNSRSRSSYRELIVLAVATSIDALAVGITLAIMPGLNIFKVAAIIGVVTCAISYAGVVIGRAFGSRMSKGAGVLGGIILIIIGIKILVEGLFFS